MALRGTINKSTSGAINVRVFFLSIFVLYFVNVSLCHAYQSLSCATAINTKFSELFSQKRVYFAPFAHETIRYMDIYFPRNSITWARLKQLNILESTRPYVKSLHVRKKQSICDKITLLHLHKYVSAKGIH